MAAKICRVVVNDSEKPGYRPEMPFFYTQAVSFDNGERIEWSDGWETFVEYPSHALAEERAAVITRRFGIRCHAHAIARPENELPPVETLPAPREPMVTGEERKTTPAPPAKAKTRRKTADRLETLRRLHKDHQDDPTEPRWYEEGQYA